jgi:uncharacterized protein (DUF2267 family)
LHPIHSTPRCSLPESKKRPAHSNCELYTVGKDRQDFHLNQNDGRAISRAMQTKIMADRLIDSAETIRYVLTVVGNHMGDGEMQKVMDSFPRDTQSLFPPLASAA